MTIQTDAGIVTGQRLSDTQYRVKLTQPVDIDLEAKPDVAYAVCGVPHALVEVPGLKWEMREQLRQQAVELRYDLTFPKGANVDFYAWENETTVRVLSYERGVEDYTLACGTGCGALTAVLYTAGKLPGKTLTALNPGGQLRVTVDATSGLIRGLYLEGPAEVVAEYTI
jgi:diaminopimelate epimerase